MRSAKRTNGRAASWFPLPSRTWGSWQALPSCCCSQCTRGRSRSARATACQQDGVKPLGGQLQQILLWTVLCSVGSCGYIVELSAEKNLPWFLLAVPLLSSVTLEPKCGFQWMWLPYGSPHLALWTSTKRCWVLSQQCKNVAVSPNSVRNSSECYMNMCSGHGDGPWPILWLGHIVCSDDCLP